MADPEEENQGSKVRIKITEMNTRAVEFFDLFEQGEDFKQHDPMNQQNRYFGISLNKYYRGHKEQRTE
jgi:hypothetical protein